NKDTDELPNTTDQDSPHNQTHTATATTTNTPHPHPRTNARIDTPPVNRLDSQVSPRHNRHEEPSDTDQPGGKRSNSHRWPEWFQHPGQHPYKDNVPTAPRAAPKR